MGNGIGGPGRKLNKGSGVRGKQEIERERGRKLLNQRWERNERLGGGRRRSLPGLVQKMSIPSVPSANEHGTMCETWAGSVSAGFQESCRGIPS